MDNKLVSITKNEAADDLENSSSSSLSSSSLSSSSVSDDGIRTLTLGDTQRLDDLGPIIINTDGTTGRISNWKTMIQSEKGITIMIIQLLLSKLLLSKLLLSKLLLSILLLESAIRLISARNKKRIEVLKQEKELKNTASLELY